jgi:hypothetical protein
MRECAWRFEWGEGSTAFLVGPPGKSVFKNQGVFANASRSLCIMAPFATSSTVSAHWRVLQHCKRKDAALPRSTAPKSNYVVNERSNSDYWMAVKSCQRCQARCE